MTILVKILTGSAGLAMIAGVTAPASAQTYPPYGGYGNQGSVGQVIGQILGGGAYGQYGQGNDRVAVDQCARAAQAQVNRRYGGYNQGYGNQGYGNNNQGYGNQGYGYNNAGAARVVAITNVERRSNGLKVSGLMATGMAYNQGYGNQGYGNQGYGNQGYGQQGYGYNQQVADLRFSCRVDYRGYVRDIDIKRNNQAYRRGY
jgi:hypothetical protein